MQTFYIKLKLIILYIHLPETAMPVHIEIDISYLPCFTKP